MTAFLIVTAIIFIISTSVNLYRWNPYDGFSSLGMLIYTSIAALGKANIHTYIHVMVWFWFIVGFFNGAIAAKKKDATHYSAMFINIVLGCWALYLYLN